MVSYPNRAEAGRQLAAALKDYRGREDVIVLALPRGGVPVAYEVAEALGAPMDLVVVRKLGTPGQEELAMGAIATGGARVMNTDVVAALRISEEVIERVVERERRELERRERAYRGERPRPELRDRYIVLIDDGLATGATMRAAVTALRQLGPARIVVAVPVAPPDTVERLRSEADEVVCLATPQPFFGVGQWYADFTQVTDDEVRRLLDVVWQKEGAAPEARP
ncbi:MAG: phosphoribosyltransferase [Gammaproteobacteria bacterium]|nr:phosphoribosyltransferase [Gammaproteobacteria bacterium]NIR28466.1 phosphoribosyltransferase [Gammaproteobacteria bacterium]NIR96912.1 phosphoribosyltransferase [Gammaproteobacteria bacterium]NIT62613.1 phosphoribosyltransferase [Gammaproteobacteria bacterium]NIV19570.1 phosphoribosyltransferase [Gammaproteobacteria bacterium]